MRVHKARLTAIACIGYSLAIHRNIAVALKIVDCGLKLIIHSMVHPISPLILELNKYDITGTREHCIATVFHISIPTTDFHTVIYCGEIKRFA